MKKTLLCLALGLAVFLPAALHAGPPLICHPYEIGSGKSLPGGTTRGTGTSYDRSRLVDDTLALLTPDTPILLRMETLRRAAIYATGNLRIWNGQPYTAEDRRLATTLLEKLQERAKNAAATNHALALFDTGFFAETLRQTELDPGVDGYALLMKAAESHGTDPEIQFALALASVRPQRKDHAQHLAQAVAGAKPDTLLATNLRSHFNR
jgi:hypothetical protein